MTIYHTLTSGGGGIDVVVVVVVVVGPINPVSD